MQKTLALLAQGSRRTGERAQQEHRGRDWVVIVALVALLEVAREFLPTDGGGLAARQVIGYLMAALTVLWLLSLVLLSVSEFRKGLNEEKTTT